MIIIQQLIFNNKANNNTGVCATNTPPEKKDSWSARLSKHQIRAWRAALLDECKAEAPAKGVLFSQTPEIITTITTINITNCLASSTKHLHTQTISNAP